MIRVLHYGLSENRGGIETYLLKLWNNIDHKHFQFDFLDMNEGAPCFKNILSEEGCLFHKVTPRRISVTRNIQELEMVFMNGKYDIFHFHVNTLSYITPIQIALKHNCRVIVHSRSSNQPKSFVTLLLHKWNSLRMPYNKVTKVAVSNIAGKWLFGTSRPFEVINNGVEADLFAFDELSRDRTRKQLQIEDRIALGHLGSFTYPKNHKYLLKIFRKVCSQDRKYVLILIGEGPLRNSIVRRINKYKLNDNVMLLGNRSETRDLLAALDIFLFPSRYEGFPNAVLEAQASGLPCLISDCITKEVIVLQTCDALALNANADYWVNKILSITPSPLSNRSTAFSEIIKSGKSVKDEIKHVEQLYLGLMTSTAT